MRHNTMRYTSLSPTRRGKCDCMRVHVCSCVKRLLLILNDKQTINTNTRDTQAHTCTPTNRSMSTYIEYVYIHRVCMCLLMLCIQNHRFEWTARICDASVYVDLSLLTNEVNFCSVRVFRTLCMLLNSLFTELSIVSAKRNKSTEKFGKKVKQNRKLSHRLTTKQNKTKQIEARR